MVLDVFDDDALAGKGGGAAGADADADFHPVERSVEKIGQAGSCAGQKMLALTVEQRDAAQHAGALLLHAAHDGFQNGGKRRAMRQQFQDMVAGLFALFGLFAGGSVAGKPAIDADEVEGGGADDDDAQQQDKRYFNHAGLPLVQCLANGLTE